MDADPEKYIRMANPSLGHTVDLKKSVAQWHEEKHNALTCAEYMMYRLDVWMHGANAWLRPGAWGNCGGHTFNDSELKGQPCVAGLDLARKTDFAAMVLAWPNDKGSAKLRPYFWIPEDHLKAEASQKPEFLDWLNAGLVTATPGNVIDHNRVQRDIYKLCEQFEVIGIIYDPAYAENIIQFVTEGVQNMRSEQVVEPLPVVALPMSQGVLTQTGPTTDFHNEVIDGKIEHESHPVFDWQMQNAQVKEDGNGNIKICKPNRKSIQTVDSAQAAVMARWGLLDCDELEIEVLDFYDNNDVEFV